MITYLIRFETVPNINGEHFGKFAGGLWTVWVLADSDDDAMRRAIDYTSKKGWQFQRHKDTHVVNRQSHISDTLLLQRFDEAQKVGISAILDTFKTRVAETN